MQLQKRSERTQTDTTEFTQSQQQLLSPSKGYVQSAIIVDSTILEIIVTLPGHLCF